MCDAIRIAHPQIANDALTITGTPGLEYRRELSLSEVS